MSSSSRFFFFFNFFFYLESRLKIYEAINTGFPAGGEGLWGRFKGATSKMNHFEVDTVKVLEVEFHDYIYTQQSILNW